MSAPATVLNAVGTFDWNTRIYGTLTAVSRLAGNIKNRANVLKLAYQLHDANRHLNEFFEIVNAAMEGKIPARPNEPLPTPQRLCATADNLEQLYRTLDYVCESWRRVGLMNNSLTAGSLRSLHRHAEAIANLADWFDLVSQPQNVTEIFDKAERERERGELVDLV